MEEDAGVEVPGDAIVVDSGVDGEASCDSYMCLLFNLSYILILFAQEEMSPLLPRRQQQQSHWMNQRLSRFPAPSHR